MIDSVEQRRPRIFQCLQFAGEVPCFSWEQFSRDLWESENCLGGQRFSAQQAERLIRD